MTVREASDHFDALKLSGSRKTIAEGVLREIVSRLSFLLDVGLDYLTLDRSGPTLSGGEAQRIRLASQLGCELSGVMYVLDEPSIGLHQRDNQRLIKTLEPVCATWATRCSWSSTTRRPSAPRTTSSTSAPGAVGTSAVKVVFSGTARGSSQEGEGEPDRSTSRAASQHRACPMSRREPPKGEILDARRGRAQPTRTSTCAFRSACHGRGDRRQRGRQVLAGQRHPAAGPLAGHLHGRRSSIGDHDAVEGLDALDKVIAIDQRPIGRTPRSNPGTYTKAFDEIRVPSLPRCPSRGPAASSRGASRSTSRGDAARPVRATEWSRSRCTSWPTCGCPARCARARRYNDQTLVVRFKGRNIAEVLDASIEECMELFANHPKLRRILQTLLDVGLGYMKIGQRATHHVGR